MRERSLSRRLALGLAAAACLTLVHARDEAPGTQPTRFLANGLDRHLAVVTSPVDGRLWGAWSYRTGAEYDVAVSVRDALGRWTEPVLLGFGSGRSEVHPALAFDGAGNLYLAHAVRETGAVVVSVLRAGSTRMTLPRTVSAAGEKATAPTLLLAGDQLIVGYRVGGRVVVRSLPLHSEIDPFGVQDGPDGFPPTRGESGGGRPTGTP
jgi:hypothetical protein